jgi:sensor histidine kinase regulating citrate/malate metabolism
MLSENDCTVYSGNGVVDILLCDLVIRAEQLGITLLWTAKLPSELNVNRVDLCALLSNGFDNALDACSQMQDNGKSITVSILLKGAYLYLSITNTIEITPKLVAGKYISTKPNPEFHGFGLKSIERIAEKYDGNLTIEHNESFFSLKCILAL